MASYKQAVFLLGTKLIGLDCILPFALQLKAENPDLSLHFLFLSKEDIAVARQNYVLWQGLVSSGRYSFLSSGRRGVTGKASAGLRLLKVLASLRRSPSLLFAYSDLARFPLRLLARACRSGGGMTVVHAKAIYPFGDALRAEQQRKIDGKDVRFHDAGDRFVLWHPQQKADYVSFCEGPATVLGTPRAYPAWQQHLKAIAQKDGLCDETGQRRDVAPGQPALVAFYIGWVEIPSVTIPPEQQFRLFFEAVRQECPHIRIWLKPHPICNQARLKAELADFADLDIVVTYAHPQVLIQSVGLGVLGNGSSVTDDLYAAHCPVLDIGVYGAGIEGSGLFANPGRIAATTVEDMRRWLRTWLSMPQQLPSPASDHLLYAKPASLLTALEVGPQ